MTISVPVAQELVSTNVVPVVDPDIGLVSDKNTISSSVGNYTEIIGTNGAVYQNSNTISLGTMTNITSGAVSVSTSNTYSMVVKDDGSLWGAGDNSQGQLGTGNTTSTARDVFVDTGLRNVKRAIACDVSTYSFTIALLNDGTVWVSGYCSHGIAGRDRPTLFQTLEFVQVTLPDKAKIIGGSRNQLVSIIICLVDGTILVAGKNTYGTLGTGNTSEVFGYRPIVVSTNESVKDLILTEACSFIVFEDGDVHAAGTNTNGAAGITPVGNLFTKVTSLSNIETIASSGYTSFAINNYGDIYASGMNAYGQLGLGDTTTRTSFTSVTAPTSGGCKGISTGQYASWYISINNDLFFSGNMWYTNTTETFPTTQTTFTVIDATRNYEYSKYLENYYLFDYTYEDANYEYLVNYGNHTVVGVSNPNRPFDGKNYSMATATTTMTYTVKGLVKFDTISIGRVKADSATIVFTLPIASPDYALWLNGVAVLSGGNGIVTTTTRTIDSTRDEEGNLEDWYTTEIFYSAVPMDIDSTVSITLTRATGEIVELGTILLGMSVNVGFTHLEMNHSYKDFSVAEYDVWGNLDYVERQRILTYKGNVSIPVTSYDRIVRLMSSLGKQLVIVNGSTSKTIAPDSQSVFALTQIIGRFMSFDSNTKIKDGDMDKLAVYSFSLEELA